MISRDEIADGGRIFRSRFVDTIKYANSGAQFKSCLVAQNCTDEEAVSIPTKAPIVQRFIQRLVPSLAASVEGMSTHTRDIMQAYI